MGNFYASYTLRGPSQNAVARALTGRSAIVTPAQNSCVVAFDEESEEDQSVIATLAARLSLNCSCPVLAVLNHDDDILWYQLYVSGELADEYDSSPDYFDEVAQPSGPAGGDAQMLCYAFGTSNVVEVENVLRKASFDENGYLFAVDRHRDLAHALGLPSFCVGTGFCYVADGELPEGVKEDQLVRVK